MQIAKNFKPSVRLWGLGGGFLGESMKKFIPREKLSRKAKKEIDRRARAVWGISPVSRKKEDKTKYNRKRVEKVEY